METKIVSVQDWQKRPTWDILARTHKLKAEWIEGEGIVVKDPDGNVIDVHYGSTADNCTTTAYVNGMGYIGGWQCLSRGRPFKELVESINAGKLYRDMNDLPGQRGRRKPKCRR